VAAAIVCIILLETRSTFGRILVPKSTLFPRILSLASSAGIEMVPVDSERRKRDRIMKEKPR